MIAKDKVFHTKHMLNCRGRLLDLSTPKVMGILNITPDSFYQNKSNLLVEKGNLNINLLLDIAGKMIEDGASILDIGGMSTRPGAEIIDKEEELNRVVPAIEELHRTFPDSILSVDTVHANVAAVAIQAGASIVNDVSAGSLDAELWPTMAKHKVPYILMHMSGNPENMQQNPSYDNVVNEILNFFIEKITLLRKSGIIDIVIDPGFGFGKTVEHNYSLLKSLKTFEILELPLLAGISRKSMICKVLKVNPSNALNGTTALHSYALMNGAKILRVHDVKEAVEAIKLYQEYDAAAL